MNLISYYMIIVIMWIIPRNQTVKDKSPGLVTNTADSNSRQHSTKVFIGQSSIDALNEQ